MSRGMKKQKEEALKRKRQKRKTLIIGVGVASLLCIGVWQGPGLIGERAREGRTINGIKTISFKDNPSMAELKKYEGEKIKIRGYMATISPLDGSFVYIMNTPFQSCPFCVPNTDTLGNTLAAYAKEGERIPFTEKPVEVVGTLIFEDTTDSFGYGYKYRLEVDKIVEVDEGVLSENAKSYAELAETGFVVDYTDVLQRLYQISSIGVSETELKELRVSNKEIEELEDKLRKIRQEGQEEITRLLSETKQIVKELNDMVEAGNVGSLGMFEERVMTTYSGYSTWLNNASF